MPRRTYSELGYTVFRSRHVLPNHMVDQLDLLAKQLGLDRGSVMEVILARWLGAELVRRPEDRDELAQKLYSVPMPASVGR